MSTSSRGTIDHFIGGSKGPVTLVSDHNFLSKDCLQRWWLDKVAQLFHNDSNTILALWLGPPVEIHGRPPFRTSGGGAAPYAKVSITTRTADVHGRC